MISATCLCPPATQWNAVLPVFEVTAPRPKMSRNRSNGSRSRCVTTSETQVECLSLPPGIFLQYDRPRTHPSPSKKPAAHASMTSLIEVSLSACDGHLLSYSSSAARSFVICRGHFATYTDDRKLFGKYVGTFWRPDHARGSPEAGEVVKQYAVHAPPQEDHP